MSGSLPADSQPVGSSRETRFNITLLSHPAVITLVVMVILVAGFIGQAGGDPLALARLGTRFSLGDPGGTEGYDGQFTYYIASNPQPEVVRALLDVPAYRYQRILLPLAARWLALGNPDWIPWTIILALLAVHTAGTWAVSELLASWQVNRRYALVYGLWAGFLLGIRLDLPEPMAYGFVALALFANLRNRPGLSWLLYGLAVFTKEVTILFVAAQMLADLLNFRWRQVVGLGLTALVPFALFQGWLWWVFGQPGVGSGGAMATSFEWIPYMGLWRIGAFSLPYLIAMLVVFGPTVILPSIWGVWKAAKCIFANERNVIVLSLLLNGLAIAFLPFSTFRETGGVIRLASGLVLAVLLFAGRYRLYRALNYSIFWIILNIFLFKT